MKSMHTPIYKETDRIFFSRWLEMLPDDYMEASELVQKRIESGECMLSESLPYFERAKMRKRITEEMLTDLGITDQLRFGRIVFVCPPFVFAIYAGYLNYVDDSLCVFDPEACRSDLSDERVLAPYIMYVQRRFQRHDDLIVVPDCALVRGIKRGTKTCGALIASVELGYITEPLPERYHAVDSATLRWVMTGEFASLS